MIALAWIAGALVLGLVATLATLEPDEREGLKPRRYRRRR